MKKTSLSSLAAQYKNKLGFTSPDVEVLAKEVVLPGKLAKLARAEEKLQRKFAQHREMFNKIASEPTVKLGNERVPARFEICSECEGRGKIATSHNPQIKFASASEYLEASQILTCEACDGKRVIKVCAGTKDQIIAYAKEEEDKKESKKDKKAAKLEAKLAKQKSKVAEKHLLLSDPDKAAALKAEKKSLKAKSKAERKLSKAMEKGLKTEKKLEKLKNKE